jgi:hypothetical protein
MTDKGMLVLQDSAHSQEDVPGSCTETSPTSSYDGNHAINIKVEEVSDVEEEDNPGIKVEHAVSSFFSFPADSQISAATSHSHSF